MRENKKVIIIIRSAININLNKEEASMVCIVLNIALRVEEHSIAPCKESYWRIELFVFCVRNLREARDNAVEEKERACVNEKEMSLKYNQLQSG